MFHRLTKAIFFGNYFYGICAVGLCMEASLQQHYPLNHTAWYILVFCGAVLYYTYAYIGESHHQNANQRTIWYTHNHKKIIASQVLLTVITAVPPLHGMTGVVALATTDDGLAIVTVVVAEQLLPSVTVYV